MYGPNLNTATIMATPDVDRETSYQINKYHDLVTGKSLEQIQEKDVV